MSLTAWSRVSSIQLREGGTHKRRSGSNFYKKLFEYDPSLKALFKGNMASQGNKLMATLGLAVKGLNDLEKLVPVLENLAKKHLEYGVKVKGYTPVGNALLFTLKQGLGSEFTPELKTAWTNLYKIVAEVMRSTAYSSYDSNTF